MKKSTVLFCMSLLMPFALVAQDVPAPTAPAAEQAAPVELADRPTPEQREAFRKQWAERRRAGKAMKPQCQNPECPCAKVFAERPTLPKPPSAEMTPEERKAFHETMKANWEAFRKKMDEARAACTCEDCFCKRRPKGRHGMRGPKGPKGPRGPRGKGMRAPQAPAPEAAPAQ